MEEELESLARSQNLSQSDLTQLAEELADLQENPLDINAASAEELERIPFLNVFQIYNLLAYRKETGAIVTIYELGQIQGWDRELIRQVRPYLSWNSPAEGAGPDWDWRRWWKYSRHRLLIRTDADLQKREGFRAERENGYLGPPLTSYLRYRGHLGSHLNIGLTAQQDAGEPWSHPRQKIGVDHLAGSIALQDLGIVKELILGDFQAGFGQGLAMWSSLAFGKSAATTDVKRYNSGFRAFRGAEENRFFRGLATSLKYQNWGLDLFYSRHALDGTISLRDSNRSPARVSALPTTGLHRTATEIAKKHINTLQSLGGHLSYRFQRLELGFTAVDHQLEVPLVPADRAYRRFRFRGQHSQNLSLDFNYIYRHFNFFGEFALDQQGAQATSLGLQMHPRDDFRFTLLLRSLDKKYQALFNAPFAENGSYGEQGAYLGWNWELRSWLALKGYLDLYHFRWLRFRIDAPASGREMLFQADLQLQENWNAYIRWRGERRSVTIPHPEGDPLARIVPQDRQNLRLHLDYRPHPQWELSSRWEGRFFSEGSEREQGFLWLQDLRYRWPGLPIKLTARYALVRTPSFDSRIYAYEHDLLYAFSIPAYYGEAQRFYLLGQWDCSENLSLQMKYGFTEFFDRNQISSGLQAVEGSVLSQVRAQVRWKF